MSAPILPPSSAPRLSAPSQIKARLKAEALKRGFDVCGVARVDLPFAESARLLEFVELGRHGSMDWMRKTAGRRAHPQALWPQARSAVMLGINYGPQEDPRRLLDHPTRGALSVYAQGDDYHDLVKGRLKTFGGWIAARLGGELKVFVDTAPLMEKPLAGRAGLGWQGKHTNLVSRDFGSWLFLGALLTTLDLEPDEPQTDHCGACRRCLDICPTDAFPAPYQLDARACLSYLTIESAAPIPLAYRAKMGNRIYGCDDCLAVCPWNKFAEAAQERRLQAREALKSPSLESLSALDDTAFRNLFAKTAVKRIGRDRFVRNVLYAVGNSAAPELAAAARRRLSDPSPLVRGAAIWALRRLLGEEEIQALRRRFEHAEPDPAVRGEWLARVDKAELRSAG
jgi:epoxyqueuosine reductase